MTPPPLPYADDAATAVSAAMRDDWARLLAVLLGQYRRLDLAEDSLAEAFEAATRTWPGTGAPRVPAAWLLTTSRRRVMDRLRSERALQRRLPLLIADEDLTRRAEATMADPGEPGGVVDERLRLVLLCSHPWLAPEHAAALTLRLVLGLSTSEVARLFLVPVPTMAARLTRARKQLAGAVFRVPRGRDLADRTALAADVAYLAFTAGHAPSEGAEVLRAELAEEAVRLARVLRETAPERLDPRSRRELDALLALMLLQHARRAARVAPDGSPVLLGDQDRSRWDAAAVTEGLALLEPHVHAPGSPYLLQALIAAEHAVAPRAEDTDWTRIVQRYDELLALGDSPVVRMHRAVAVAEVGGPDVGLEALAGVEVPGHRLPATRGALLARAGRTDEARAAYDEALAACANEAEAGAIARRRQAL